MTGVSMSAQLQDDEISAALRHLSSFGQDKKPLLKRVGVALVDATQEHFREGKDPEGKVWQALRPFYALYKEGPGILRGPRSGAAGLMGSITFKLQGADQVAVGSNKIYAAVHQFGAVIGPVKAKALRFHIGPNFYVLERVVIPARPYLGFGKAERLAVMEQVEFALNEAIAGYGARQILSRD